MAINSDRLEALAVYLDENPERAEYLIALSAEEAAVKINADGHDFTCEELGAYAKEIDKLIPNQNGELDEESLDDVAGGRISWLVRVLCPPPFFGTWEMLRRKGRGW